MVSSRAQAMADLGVTAALAITACSPRVPARIRRVAGTAAAAQAVCSACTSYEGGVVRLLSYPRYRMLKLAGAAAVLAAGGWRSRVVMAAATVQAATAVLAEGQAQDAPPSMAYRPLDTPKRVANDLWVVDGVKGPIPIRMTVIRLDDGGLLLHSPTPFSAGLRTSLEQIGPIRHLVAPNIVHWVFAKAWQDAVPGVELWAAPGLRRRRQVRQAGLRIDHDLSDQAPPAWSSVIEQAVVPGGLGFTEVVFHHRPSRTVLMADLVQNFEPAKLPWPLRLVGRALGNVAPSGRAPAHLRAVMRRHASAAAAAARRIVDWEPVRILVAHGLPIEQDAAARLRRSLAWLTEGGW